MRRIAILGLLPALAWAGVPADLDSLEREAAGLIPAFQQHLLQTVQTALKAGGPAQAVEACRQLAPAIAAAHSRSPWTVGRTALRLRNPDNRADAWERQVLEDFVRRQRAGEDLARMSASAVVAGEFRYMQAIATGEPCLACHGQALEPGLAALIEQHYPNDQAQGFRLGELRGAFSLRRPLPEPAP